MDSDHNWNEWYKSNTELADFAQALMDDSQFNEMVDLVEFIREPWKMNDLYVSWLRAGKPVDFDFDDARKEIFQRGEALTAQSEQTLQRSGLLEPETEPEKK